MKRAEKREHLLEVAGVLFNRFGYRGVGIDQVIAESGVAKATLYRHFPTKEDLIVAVLKRRDEQSRDEMRVAVDRLATDPRDKILATFDVLEQWFEDKEFYGCPFIAAAGEYGERTHPIFKEAEAHSELMVAYLEELAAAAGLDRPKELAREIGVLQVGAIAVAHLTGDAATARRTKAVAAKLIDGAGKAG